VRRVEGDVVLLWESDVHAPSVQPNRTEGHTVKDMTQFANPCVQGTCILTQQLTFAAALAVGDALLLLFSSGPSYAPTDPAAWPASPHVY